MLRLARQARELTGLKQLCLAGGVALNCVANGRILREKIFERIWIQPAAGDAGGALGAALAAWHRPASAPAADRRDVVGQTTPCREPSLGPHTRTRKSKRPCAATRRFISGCEPNALLDHTVAICSRARK